MRLAARISRGLSLASGYGAQTMAVGGAGLASAALGLARLKLWDVLSGLFGGRHAVFYSITTRRTAHPEDFKADMATLFDLLRDRAIHPFVIDRLPLAAAREVHTRIDRGITFETRNRSCRSSCVRARPRAAGSRRH